ncbi:hypothetical protein VTO73DRAFT_11871 [Trametes versicolor]
MNTAKLGDDILAGVIPHLSSADALLFGATCSFLRAIAVRHAVRDVSFDLAERFTKFSAFMLARPSRLPHLRRLTLGSNIVNRPITLLIASLDGLAQLVEQASGLEHLSLNCTEVLFSFEPFLKDVLASNVHITSLRLSTLGRATQEVLLNMRCAPILRELVLVDGDYVSTRLKSNTVLLPPLPSLRTLTLHNLISIPLRATFSSLMPALKTLRLRSLEFVDADPEPGEWWTTLELIRGDIPSLVSLRIPRPVRSLTIDVTLENEEAWDPALLLDVFQRASPTCLSIGLQASFREPFWQTYLPALPRLRYLRLIVEASDPGEMHNCSDWLDNICMPGARPLIGVSVYVCVSPDEPRDGTLTAEPLHIRIRDALSRALPTVRLFGFAVG